MIRALEQFCGNILYIAAYFYVATQELLSELRFFIINYLAVSNNLLTHTHTHTHTYNITYRLLTVWQRLSADMLLILQHRFFFNIALHAFYKRMLVLYSQNCSCLRTV